MGLYDRDYGRDYDASMQPGIHLGGPRTVSTNIVLFTFGVYLLQLLTSPAVGAPRGDDGFVTNLFSLYGNTLTHPWLLFEFLTYGFLHSPTSFAHILGNMFGLWMFGRAVEGRYGRKEFLTFYLVAIIFAGASWYGASFLTNKVQLPIQMLGASGGVSAVLILFALNFPRQELAIWGVFPMPAWVFAVLIVGYDVLGAMDRTSTVACTAHLGGAFFALLYFKNGWKLQQWLPGGWSMPRPARKTKLRIHEPEESESDTDRQVDEILKKIAELGKDSLTWRERRILEKASKEYQRKRQ